MVTLTGRNPGNVQVSRGAEQRIKVHSGCSGVGF